VWRAVLLATTAAVLAWAQTAAADHAQPKPDIGAMPYAYADGGKAPKGSYQWGEPIPGPSDAGTLEPNPSGQYLAYDMDVFESLTFPGRQPGDTSDKDEPGNGGMPYGFCPPDPMFVPQGHCANHQLEYLNHYESTMKEMLKDFGVVVHRYQFESPGSRQVEGSGTVGGLQAAPGRAFNISATIPGADHPDEEVLVSGHFDFTDGGHAAAWDSSEGHTEVIRIAKIMSDYWRKTGTRPSATVKFIPFDSEESGSYGSADYVEHNIPPGNEGKVRGYFNMDPCAGGYPAFYHGNPAQRINQVLQLSDPAAEETVAAKKRDEVFNTRMLKVIDEVLDHLDDHMITQPDNPEIFVSDAEAKKSGGTSERSQIVTALGGLLLFSSDYANFDAIGVPVFNLFPDVFGPHADGTPASGEGATILHNPRDNLTTLNALTSTDQSGLTASEGWAKGMEWCAHAEAWGMLQPETGGGQTRNEDVVAYYEALPNEAIQRQNVVFDAAGSYQYADAAARAYVDESKLEFIWDFGDGSQGSGKRVEHGYADVGRYQSKLTVRNTETGQADTMTLPIEVIPSNFTAPVLKKPAATDEDGSFPLSWEFEGSRSGLKRFQVEESTDLAALLSDDAEGDIGKLWSPSEPDDPQVQPWQKSDGSPAPRGANPHDGESSYWTGVVPTSPAPTGKQSILTLKKAISVPADGEPVLGYFSFFQNEGDDEGRVEVALDDGVASTPLQWQPVDGLGGIFDPTDPATTLTAGYQARRVDLSRFKGKKILIRFNYILGPDDRVASQPTGWYIDDIHIESGTWKPIGTSTTKELTVFGKTKGKYGYRVKGVYNDAVQTQPSNAETVEVTKGVAAVLGANARCSSTLGFRGATAAASRRGLKFRFTSRAGKPVTVSVIRQAVGRRIGRNRTVKRFEDAPPQFSWAGRRGLRAGYYVVRFRMELGKVDAIREVGFQRRGGRFRKLRAFHRPESCSTLRSFKLGRPVFGGTSSRPLRIDFRLARDAAVGVVVKRGRKVVTRYRSVPRQGRVTYHLRLSARSLRRGDYRVQLRIAKKRASELFGRRL
jgi:PKD repeat protein